MSWKVGAIAGLCGLGGAIVGALLSPALSSLVGMRSTPVQETEVYDQALLGPAIEQYLLTNPDVLQRATVALQAQIAAATRERNRAAIAEMGEELFSDEAGVVVGNPEGDVTLVEMYDYNCGFCRSSLPDIVTLVADDPQLRVVLRQFPVLSEGSVEAARVGAVVAIDGRDYWAFHQAIFTSRGQVNGDVALRAAESIGLVASDVRRRTDDPDVSAVIDKSYQIARRLEITGTPTFIIGDEIVRGAVGLASLREKVANLRTCGKTACG